MESNPKHTLIVTVSVTVFVMAAAVRVEVGVGIERHLQADDITGAAV